MASAFVLRNSSWDHIEHPGKIVNEWKRCRAINLTFRSSPHRDSTIPIALKAPAHGICFRGFRWWSFWRGQPSGSFKTARLLRFRAVIF